MGYPGAQDGAGDYHFRPFPQPNEKLAPALEHLFIGGRFLFYGIFGFAILSHHQSSASAI
jgi:hypothetical protein